MIGVIGGSGLYEIDGLQQVRERRMETPFGAPSDAYVCGKLGGCDVCFLPRHGRGHVLMPSEINHRANIMGFKLLGARRLISVSAVGSLKEDLRPRDIALPDQYFDRTKRSHEHTFFGQGAVAHIAFSEPACPEMREAMAAAARRVIAADGQTQARVHEGGTYVGMEGPAFSTKAESLVYRRFGFDVIGMTGLGEAKLAREAEICYQAMAMVTDYDCWHEEEEAVSVERVIEHLMANTRLAKAILVELMPALSEEPGCACGAALANALLTRPEHIPEATRQRLEPLIGKYL